MSICTSPVQLASALADGTVTPHRDGTFTTAGGVPYSISQRDAKLTVSILYMLAASELTRLAATDEATSDRYIRLTASIAHVAIGAANLRTLPLQRRVRA